jgi:hypothetical protein
MTPKHDATPNDGPTDDGRELESKHPAQQKRDDGATVPLPSEADQQVDSQDDATPREVGEQAHEDLERGLKDTDRRGDPQHQNLTRTKEDRR